MFCCREIEIIYGFIFAINIIHFIDTAYHTTDLSRVDTTDWFGSTTLVKRNAGSNTFSCIYSFKIGGFAVAFTRNR